jgi:HlyD family secretion protein
VLDVRKGVLRVPTFAVLEDKRVLLVENGKAVARDVTIGLRNWEWAEIRSGLEGGETVITSVDKQGVRAGARVAVQAAPGGPSAERSGAAAAEKP